MSNYERFNNFTGGISHIVTSVAVVGAAVWAYASFPDLEETLRRWPPRPDVDGCLAIRRTALPKPLKSGTKYVEFGLSINNPTTREATIDSVIYTVQRGAYTQAAVTTNRFEVDDDEYINYSDPPEIRGVLSPLTVGAPSGFKLRPGEAKSLWRGLLIREDASAAPYLFRMQLFFRGDDNPFGWFTTAWLDDPIGKCPWNSSPTS